MNKEQFIKAIDNVDDELLKGVFEDFGDELPDAEAQHGAVYRPERRSRRKTFIAAAACLTAVAGAGFAVKASVDGVSTRNTSHIEAPANTPDDITVSSDINNTSDISVSSVSSSDVGNSQISKDNLPKEERSFGMGYSMSISFSDNEDQEPNRISVTEPQTVTAALSINLTPDKKMPIDNFPYRIFVFADGKPIEFAPEGSDDFALHHDFFMDESNNFTRYLSALRDKDPAWKYWELKDTIKISFKADESMHMISFVLSVFPEYFQPQSWIGYGGTFSDTVVNTAYVPGALPETKQLGEYIPARDDKMDHSSFFFIRSSEDRLYEPYLDKDLEYSEDNNTLLLEFNSGRKDENWLKSRSYYLFLMIDGELQPAFDGDYSYLVDCEYGDRIFRYQIPTELLPTSGNHTIQGVAIPADHDHINITEYFYLTDSSSARIRAVALTE